MRTAEATMATMARVVESEEVVVREVEGRAVAPKAAVAAAAAGIERWPVVVRSLRAQ